MNGKDNIRKYRKELKMSQKDFAERVGVNRILVSRYERGESRPSLKTLDRLVSMARHDKKPYGYDFFQGNDNGSQCNTELVSRLLAATAEIDNLKREVALYLLREEVKSD